MRRPGAGDGRRGEGGKGESRGLSPGVELPRSCSEGETWMSRQEPTASRPHPALPGPFLTWNTAAGHSPAADPDFQTQRGPEDVYNLFFGGYSILSGRCPSCSLSL